jgi:hypothetical protein
MLKNVLDGNWWAEKIGNKTGMYDKAHNSRLANWSRNLTGWKYWAWQIVGGLIGLVVLELLINQFGMTMLPWR